MKPGPNRVRFTAAPLKRGVYALKYVAARLAALPLRIPAIPPPGRYGLQPLAATTAVAATGTAAAAAARPLLAVSTRTGQIERRAVVLAVEPCQRRLGLSAVAVQVRVFAMRKHMSVVLLVGC